MSKQQYLTCKRVTFYARLDEDAFFEWIKKIECIESFEGARDELYLDLVDRELGYDDMTDLIALFYRYKIDMKQLGKFINKKNEDAYVSWWKKIFGSAKEKL